MSTFYNSNSAKANALELIGEDEWNNEEQTIKISAHYTGPSGPYNNRKVMNTRKLYGMEISEIPKQNTAFSPIKRLTNTVNLLRFKYKIMFRNDAMQPVVFNYAIIAPKNKIATYEGEIAPTQPYVISGLADDKFFESGAGTIGQDMQPNLTSIEYNHLAINPIKHSVLMHKRVTLGERPGGSTYRSINKESSYKYVEGELPINRQVKYTNTSHHCDTPIYMVFWCDHVLDESGTASTPSVMYVMMDNTLYWTQGLVA